MTGSPGSLAGLGVLTRHYLRRDRWVVLWLSLGMLLLYVTQAVSIDGLYANQAEFDAAAAAMESNVTFVALTGPTRALNTVGGQVAWQGTAFGAVVAGLVSMMLIGRHTRAEEESGRDELIRSSVVSRRAPMTAALLATMIVNLIAGAVNSASLIGYGLPVPGSLIMGVGVMLCGWLFAAVALLVAQLTASTRTAYGITGAVIAVAYGLRAIGDVTGSWLSWVSPIGWYQAMHGFSGDRWWPGLLLLAGTVVVATAAYVVFDRRDMGAGVLATRPGPLRASAGLSSGHGLAWRLQRGSLLAWCLGMFLGGIAYGSIGDEVSLFGDSDLTNVFIPDKDAMVDSFYAVSAAMLVLIAAAFTISSALRPREEEDGGRLEPLQATALPRLRWLLAHLVITLAGTVVLVGLSGLGLGLGYTMATGDQTAIWRFSGATLALLPGALLLGAIARLLFGWLPAWAPLAWLGLAYCAFMLIFGDLLRLPDWMQDLSPFRHFALVPAEPMDWTSFLVVLLLAAVTSAAGVIGFLRRDLRG